MSRLCVRPGCDRDARARLTYDVVGCQVWLDPISDWPGGAQELCDVHLGRLTVPRGWMLCDRRAVEPSLFVAEATGTFDASADSDAAASMPPSPVGRPGRRRRQAASSEESPDLVLFSHAEPDPDLAADPVPAHPEPVSDPQPEPAAAEPEPAPAPEPKAAPEPKEPARPTSPLLARAFAATGPQRSVLTHFVEEQTQRDE